MRTSKPPEPTQAELAAIAPQVRQEVIDLERRWEPDTRPIAVVEITALLDPEDHIVVQVLENFSALADHSHDKQRIAAVNISVAMIETLSEALQQTLERVQTTPIRKATDTDC